MATTLIRKIRSFTKAVTLLAAAGSIGAMSIAATGSAAAAAPEQVDAVTATVRAAATAAPEDVVQDAAGARYMGYFIFEKNKKNPSNSRLSWQVWRVDPDPPRKTVDVTWRAGSGDGSTNTCLRNHGWLPNGWYGGTFKTGFDGIINGIVWQLDNKKCHNGTPRTELFIHSEMTPSGGQNCGYEPECWNGPSDYKSNGCVKLKPADIKSAAELYRALYGKSAKKYKKRLLLVV